MTTSSEIVLNCLQIENITREFILMKNISDFERIVEVVNEVYNPESQLEMEMYSEAILYSRMALLN